MKYFSTFCLSLAALVLLVTLGSVSPAQACSASNPTACTTAQWQATRIPYTGPTSPRQVDTCVRLLATSTYAHMTEVVLVAGADAEHGRVITSLGRGNGHSFQLANQPAGTEDVYVREFCFEGSLIAGLDAITFCNGINRGDGNHHTLSLYDSSAPYLRNLQQTGHVGDFLTLLGTERTYGSPYSVTTPIEKFFTGARYDRLYGRHGEWLGS